MQLSDDDVRAIKEAKSLRRLRNLAGQGEFTPR